jgi:hypothetical protein
MAGSTHQSRRGKTQLKPSEVCARFDVQPYVLKFWEGEFPQLGRRLGPKRVYGPRELEIVEAIHHFVEEEGLNLGEARDALSERFAGGADSDEPPEAQAAEPSPAAPASGSTAGGLFGQAEARIRELEKEAERVQKLADDERARASESEAQAQQLGRELNEAKEAGAELERRLAELQSQLDRAESARAVAMARIDELETALDEERAAKDALERQADDLSSLVETAGDAEQRLDAAREESERLRRAFEDERRQRRDRDRRLAREVAESLDELSLIESLAGTLLEEISGQSVEAEEAGSGPEDTAGPADEGPGASAEEHAGEDDPPPYPDEEN